MSRGEPLPSAVPGADGGYRAHIVRSSEPCGCPDGERVAAPSSEPAAQALGAYSVPHGLTCVCIVGDLPTAPRLGAQALALHVALEADVIERARRLQRLTTAALGAGRP